MPDDTITHEYYERIKREHRELGVAIEDAKAAFEACPRNVVAVQTAVERLCRLVDVHFAHEEEGGFLREAIERAPRIALRASDLLEQHAALKSAIIRLHEQVRAVDAESGAWDNWHDMFAAFIADLSDHESGENALLQEAYTDDIGTKD